MTPPTDHQEYTLTLSREEQWVLHHIMLNRMELEAEAPADTDPPPLGVYRVFEKLETGTHRFSRCECLCLRDELRRYLETIDTPERDESIAEQLLDELPQAGQMASPAEPSL